MFAEENYLAVWENLESFHWFFRHDLLNPLKKTRVFWVVRWGNEMVMTEEKNVHASYIFFTWGRDVIAKWGNGSKEIAGRL